MKIKVCGMKYKDNLEDLIRLKPDYIGFIFYEKSKRYCGDNFDFTLLNIIPKSIKKVAVIVNAPIDKLLHLGEHFDYLQLHGSESPSLCQKLKEKKINIIKAFAIEHTIPIKQMYAYVPYIDFFLLDTKTNSHGGSGKTFDWELLKNYTLDLPYFLAGGIAIDHIEALKHIEEAQFFAVDINSRFELKPAVKDAALIKKFIKNSKNGISGR